MINFTYDEISIMIMFIAAEIDPNTISSIRSSVDHSDVTNLAKSVIFKCKALKEGDRFTIGS